MATIRSFTQDTGFSETPYVFDWVKDSSSPGMALPRALTTTVLATYNFDVADIAIDRVGTAMTFSRCSQNLFNGNLASSEGVLLGDNRSDNRPIHLTFARPLRALGVCISAVGNRNTPYVGVLWALIDNEWKRFVAPGELSSKRGSAPFVGLQVGPGSRITEAWFDADDAGHPNPFPRVAIGSLHYLV
ncbi:MAG: hypothetical protein QM769_14100 [Pseudoxanthomonas sp.]